MQAISTALIFGVGLVNLLPVSGVLSANRLQALYGVAIEDVNFLVLMRHRAVLFGIVGGLLVASVALLGAALLDHLASIGAGAT